MGDPTDPIVLDNRVTYAQSYKDLLHPSGSQWSKVVHRLERLASTQSVPCSDATDMDEGHQNVFTLHNHAVAIHQWVHPHEKESTTESRCSPTSASPFYMERVHIPSSNLRSSLRSAEVFTNTIVENPQYANRVLSTPRNHDRLQLDMSEATRGEKLKWLSLMTMFNIHA